MNPQFKKYRRVFHLHLEEMYLFYLSRNAKLTQSSIHQPNYTLDLEITKQKEKELENHFPSLEKSKKTIVHRVPGQNIIFNQPLMIKIKFYQR